MRIVDATQAMVRDEIERAHQEKVGLMMSHLGDHGWVRQGGIIGGLLRVDPKVRLDGILDWAKRPLRLEPGVWFLPHLANLVTNSGVHIGAQRTWVKTTGGDLTAETGSTNDGVRYGGIDNVVTAVSATTHQFSTTGSNRFITLLDLDPTYDTTNKRITAEFTVTNSDTTITHERVGFGNSASNVANSLYSMISDYTFTPGASLTYSLTYQGQVNYTGS